MSLNLHDVRISSIETNVVINIVQCLPFAQYKSFVRTRKVGGLEAIVDQEVRSPSS